MNTPKIRIKGFCGEWNNSLIGDLFDERVEYNPLAEMLTVSINRGIYRAADNGRYDNSSPNKSKYKLVKVGDIAYNSMRMWQGASGCSQLEGIVSPAYTVIKPREDINSFFFAYLFKTKRMIRTFRLNSQGLTSDTWNLKYPALSQIRVSYPCDLSEQRSIAEYFRNIDSLIETAEKKLISLKQVKEASLQSMFPQEGCTVPQVRFKGFDGEWKKALLGDLFTERVESNVNGEMLSVTQSQGIIKASENGRYDNSNADKSKYRVVKTGDIAYNSMRMWQGASGYSPYEGIVSPAYTVVVPNEGVDSLFFSYSFKTNLMIKQFRLRSQGLTKDTWNLKYPAFSLIGTVYPVDIEEQRKIALFFTDLDKAIENQKQRLELLKRIKSTCLSEMFV